MTEALSQSRCDNYYLDEYLPITPIRNLVCTTFRTHTYLCEASAISEKYIDLHILCLIAILDPFRSRDTQSAYTRAYSETCEYL